jgi:purine nucleosidase
VIETAVAAPRKVLLDTDIGSDVDDALALGLMLTAPEALDLVAVTTVSRDAAVRARVAAGLLGLGGRGDVEVCIGEARPILRGENRFVWFGHEERCIVEGPAASITAEPAPERIVRAARETRALELLAVGPLTNVARALALDPELPERLAGLTIMGGQIREARIGRQQGEPSFEYNLCSDPEATVAVLGAGFRTTLVPADVTLLTWLRDADVEQLAAAGPLARALAEQVRRWKPVQQKLFPALGRTLEPDNAAFLHDPLTVLALLDDPALHFERLRIVPTVAEGTLRTLEVDPQLGIGCEMRVATRVDARAAERAITERLLRL